MAADKRITRAVYGAFVLLTAVFVVLLISEIASQVFGDSASSRVLPQPCKDGIASLADAVESAVRASGDVADPDAAVAKYRSTRDDRWKAKAQVEATCASDPRGLDAMAALVRFDRAAEGIARRTGTELRAVRREVDSFIR